jgi:hypothetical protein
LIIFLFALDQKKADLEYENDRPWRSENLDRSTNWS